MTSLEDLPVPEVVSLMKDGQRYYFQNVNGKPFYTYDKDSNGHSDCYDRCAQIWEPVLAPDGEGAMGNWTVVKRADQRMQWAYKGSPIYTNRVENIRDVKPELSQQEHWHILVP